MPRRMSVSRPPATPALPKELVSFSPSVPDRARGFPGSVPGDQDPPADIVEMPGIGDDQHWPSGGERNLLRTRPDQLRFCAIGIELAEDGQIGIAGVQCRIGVGTLRDLPPPLGRLLPGWAENDVGPARRGVPR